MATLDPSVFYRDFAADSPITSGAQHLSAAATRLAFSIVYSITELPDAIWQQFKELLTPDTLWGLALVVAAWLIATIIGGPIGAAINGLLAAYGLYELWPVVKAVVGDLWAWLRSADEVLRMFLLPHLLLGAILARRRLPTRARSNWRARNLPTRAASVRTHARRSRRLKRRSTPARRSASLRPKRSRPSQW